MTEGGQLCRLELWGANGWAVTHAGVSLLHPEGYVERLAANGKVGRVTVLGEKLEPVRVFQDGEPPPLSEPCPFCDLRHTEPHDGTCLL